jgi:hypothetical protein
MVLLLYGSVALAAINFSLRTGIFYDRMKSTHFDD